MAWFKVDDAFPTHPKVRSIPRRERPAALGLWLAAGTWSAKHLTDGVIPGWVVDEEGTPALAAHLVTSGLWHERGSRCSRCPKTKAGEWRFHDWADYQPTKAAAEERRRIRSLAGAKGGVVSGRVRRLRAVGDDEPPPEQQ